MIKPETRESIILLRQQGESFTEIGKALSLSPNTVKSICRRGGIKAEAVPDLDPDRCKNCGEPLPQIPGKKRKTFCSARCRTAWWNKTRSRRPYRLGRPGVYQLWEQEKELLQPGMPPDRPLRQNRFLTPPSGSLAQLRGKDMATGKGCFSFRTYLTTV